MMLKQILSAFLLFFAVGEMAASDFNIIPRPRQMTEQAGTFSLSATTRLGWRDEEGLQVARFFAEKYETATGRKLALVKLKKEGKKQKEPLTDMILFLIDGSVAEQEGYHLDVTPERVTATARTGDGLFYALQTLLQLCPPDVENQTALKTAAKWNLPCVSIDDAPRFAYRGVHLDPCRHFISAAVVKKQIDMLATYKINKLHFHLTDDQGWRIQIKKYPELTSIGARRLEGEGNYEEGFYTQDEIRDIVAYAKERHIDVVPEIELPGHGLAAIAAYPELSCRGDSITPRIIWGVEDVVMCPGKETMFRFLEDVIDEVSALFPSPLFHIGGDESPRTEWQHCDSCQARMKSLGLQREAQLQDYVIERIGSYLKAKGKSIIGWDEILEGGNLEKSAIVMSWRGEEGAVEAARKGHKSILTPSSHGFYFDHYQGDPITEPTAIGGYAPLEKVYGYDPVPAAIRQAGLDSLVMGVQANNWSEYITSPSILELRLYPRALALAEIAWTPADKKDFKDFCRRVDNDATKRLLAHHVNLHIPQPEMPGISSNKLAFTQSRTVTLTTTRPLPILYTTDGTRPTVKSDRYITPLTFDRTCQLKAAVLLPCGVMGPVRTIRMTKEELAPAAKVEKPQKGLLMSLYWGDYRRPGQLPATPDVRDSVITDLRAIRSQTRVPASVRNVKNYAAVAEGYISVPADGVYEFTSNNAQVYIDGNLQIDNSGVYAPRDTRENVELALAHGLHRVKVVFMGGVFGGWPTYWDAGDVHMRPSGGEWKRIAPEALYH